MVEHQLPKLRAAGSIPVTRSIFLSPYIGREEAIFPVGKHIKTISRPALAGSLRKGGCGECQTSCQSACKTSLTVGNQACLREKK